MPNKFIFTLTTGRSGTAYLASLLNKFIPQADVFHEHIGYDKIGFLTPDISTLVAFNNRGFDSLVKDFWEQKWMFIEQNDSDIYVETSHQLMKAGLVEYCYELLGDNKELEFHFIQLERDMTDTVISHLSRNDFTRPENMWLWYLDPDYSNNLINADPFLENHPVLLGRTIWYQFETRLRSRVYAKIYENTDGMFFHNVQLQQLNDKNFIQQFLNKLNVNSSINAKKLPAPKNVDKRSEKLGEEIVKTIKNVINSVQLDYDQLIDQVFENKNYLPIGFLWAPSSTKTNS